VNNNMDLSYFGAFEEEPEPIYTGSDEPFAGF
jgi:hypothetical protein